MGPTPVVPIRVEAAHRIEELEAKVRKLRKELNDLRLTTEIFDDTL